MQRCFPHRLLLAGILGIVLALSARAMDVTVSTAAADSAVVGGMMTWTAESSDEGTLRYRFRIRRMGGDYQMIRDYGPVSWLDWAAECEGMYELEVSAKNLATGESSTATKIFPVVSRISGNEPEVNSTNHPLVFLLSAPPCPTGSRMRAKFQALGSDRPQQTLFKNCRAGLSMNFYLAGLYAESAYFAWTELDTGDAITAGQPIKFETGPVAIDSWKQTVLKTQPARATQPVLLSTAAGSQIATDLNGTVIWYNPSPVTYATRVDPGGYLWGFLEDDSATIERQGIRKVDLLGQTVLETNAERVNEQLEAMGKRRISGFHHEARTLPDGRIAALASVEQILTDVQGPGEVDVLGDMIIVFDPNLQVLWTWDTFDHLDVSRKATMGEVCPPGGGGCPPFYLASIANDWTHGNSIQQTPDGNLLYSARHQDWLIKINYANGEGDGSILWRLGKDGDFTYAGNDPYPWFSHQHDANFETANRIAVFDNGNTRFGAEGHGNSRGQVIELDEQNRTAKLILNADLGVFSAAVGSAQRLVNGNYHFDAGFVSTPAGLSAYAFEVNPSGQIVSSIEANTLLYRSIRMTDMYTVN